MWSGRGNEKKIIPIKEIARKYGADICSILPIIHAISGCDITSVFNGYGTTIFFKCLHSDLHEDHDFIENLNEIGEQPNIPSEKANHACDKLLFKLYGKSEKQQRAEWVLVSV